MFSHLHSYFWPALAGVAPTGTSQDPADASPGCVICHSRDPGDVDMDMDGDKLSCHARKTTPIIRY